VRQPFEISLVLCVSQPAAIRGNLRFTKRGKLLKMIDNWMALRTLACRCLRGVFALFVAVLCLLSTAQAGVVNGDFESGDFTGWTVTNYRNNGIATFPPTQKSHLNLQPPVTAPVTQVVSAASGTPASAPDAPGQPSPSRFRARTAHGSTRVATTTVPAASSSPPRLR